MADRIVRKGKLVSDANGNYYFYDCNNTGLFFALNMILRQHYSDEKALNTAINDLNDELAGKETSGQNEYFCTLGMVPKQAANLVASGWDTTLYSKIRFFLYDSTFKGKIGDQIAKYGAMEADFVWINNDTVYTRWDENALGYRFPRTSKITIVSADDEDDSDSSDSSDSSDTDSSSGSTGTTISGDTNIHIYCPHCGKKII